MQIANSQALLARYNMNNYVRLAEFWDKLPPDQQPQFQVLVDEGGLVAKVGLQVTVDTADTSSHSLVTGIIMHWDSCWPQSTGFPRGPNYN